MPSLFPHCSVIVRRLHATSFNFHPTFIKTVPLGVDVPIPRDAVVWV